MCLVVWQLLQATFLLAPIKFLMLKLKTSLIGCHHKENSIKPRSSRKFLWICLYFLVFTHMLDSTRLGKAAAVKGERCRSNRSGNAKNNNNNNQGKQDMQIQGVLPRPLSWMFSHRSLLLNQDWCKVPALPTNGKFFLSASSTDMCMQHRWIQCRKIMYEYIFSYHTYTEKQRIVNNLRLFLYWSSDHLGGRFDFWSKKPPSAALLLSLWGILV